MWGFIGGLLGITYNVVKDAKIQNSNYGIKDYYKDNPTELKKQKGFDRMMEDYRNGVPKDEQNRRRALGYYNGEDVQI